MDSERVVEESIRHDSRLLDEYQDFTDEVSIYPEAGSGSKLAQSYAFLEMGNEAGEAQGKVKKYLRGDQEMTSEYREAIADELGDVLFGLTRCATEIGYDLFTILYRNQEKLRDRALRNQIRGDGDRR